MDSFAHFMGTLALREPMRDLSNQRTLDASRRSEMGTWDLWVIPTTRTTTVEATSWDAIKTHLR